MTRLDRRSFLGLTGAAALGTLLPRPLFAAPNGKQLSILVLGGTKFLGPAIVEAALQRGHKVALFNRGKTNADWFPTAEKIRGDRDPKVGDGIKALEGRRFDVVFDDNGYVPRIVGASAQLMSKSAKQYIYVSSISAYKDPPKVGSDETAPLATMADPTVESLGASYENYGALKALSENAVRSAFGERATIVRPGYIVGPNDATDRFTYWVVRPERGGEMLAPGDGSDPVQIIDVRDLGSFMVHLAEEGSFGTFNACGPAKQLKMREVIAACCDASGNKAKPTWVPNEFLSTRSELQGDPFPIWAPGSGDSAGYHTIDNRRAIAAGLTFRPLAETVKATLAWFHTLPPERQAALKAGLSAAQEAAILADWKAKGATPISSEKPRANEKK